MPQLAKLVTLTAFLVPGVIGRPAFSLTHQYCKLPLKEKDPIKSYSPITWTSREISYLAYHFGSSYANNCLLWWDISSSCETDSTVTLVSQHAAL